MDVLNINNAIKTTNPSKKVQKNTKITQKTWSSGDKIGGGAGLVFE